MPKTTMRKQLKSVQRKRSKREDTERWCGTLSSWRKHERTAEKTVPPSNRLTSNRMNQDSTLESEWGSVANVRYLLSSIGSVTANASALGADVYNIFHCARESYCCIEQDGYSASFLYRPPIYDGPLALNASVGWRFAEVPRIECLSSFKSSLIDMEAAA